MPRCRTRTALLPVVLAALAGAGPMAAAAEHAVILLYHHVAEDTPASTSVSPATFAGHLDYLQANDYRVLPLSRIIAALSDPSAPALPERAVAITFDDAYRSVYSQAAPLLARHGYPFAVFVSTDYIDAGFGNYLTWEELRELEARGVEVANHSRSHPHYLLRRADESEADWRQRIATDMRAAAQRLDEELKEPLRAIAYPYGEFDPALTELTAELGLVGFGQQSGPVGRASNLQALARFPMAGRYADTDGLAEKLRTRPFAVTVLSDVGPVLDATPVAPTLRLRLEAEDASMDALACFVSGQRPPEVRWIDRERGVVEVTARAPLPTGRSKYTCTAPARAGGRVFYWYSHLWMTPPGPHAWYRD
ncbi:MAG: polysaccharide deacetylase family protein [Pseudomonadales bacterium]